MPRDCPACKANDSLEVDTRHGKTIVCRDCKETFPYTAKDAEPICAKCHKPYGGCNCSEEKVEIIQYSPTITKRTVSIEMTFQVEEYHPLRYQEGFTMEEMFGVRQVDFDKELTNLISAMKMKSRKIVTEGKKAIAEARSALIREASKDASRTHAPGSFVTGNKINKK